MHFKVLWPVKPALRACSGFHIVLERDERCGRPWLAPALAMYVAGFTGAYFPAPEPTSTFWQN